MSKKKRRIRKKLSYAIMHSIIVQQKKEEKEIK